MSSFNIAKDKGAVYLLEADHAELDESLRGVFAAIEASDGQESFARLDLFWARLAMHIRAEHLQLFPAVLDALAGNPDGRACVDLLPTEVSDLIEHLRGDHDFFMHELARAVNLLRELLDGVPDHTATAARLLDVRQTVTTVSRRLTEHNQLEEANIYRWTAEVLTASEQTQLADGVRREITNMPARFTTTA